MISLLIEKAQESVDQQSHALMIGPKKDAMEDKAYFWNICAFMGTLVDFEIKSRSTLRRRMLLKRILISSSISDLNY